jgi:malonyl CoA-acyl carrier protein transacylase
MKAYLFPGQGSQHVGMGGKLFDAFPRLVQNAEDILGYSLRRLCLEDPDRTLSQTQFTQPALFVVNALSWRARREEHGEEADFAAGHSLGEYNALEYAGAMSFEDGLRLVQKRGALMSLARDGGMAAIIGLDGGSVRATLVENGFEDVDVANYNAPTQTVVSGLREAVAMTREAFEARGAMFVPLNVSGAFHSRYMQPAREDYEIFVADFSFASPRFPVIANVSAEPYGADVGGTLARQLTQSVRWSDSMMYLLRAGAKDFIEVGPREVLSNLMKSIRTGFRSQPAETPAPRALSPEEKTAEWNRAHPVGARVRVKGYAEPLTTKSEAVILFGHRAAVYMQGYNGYFALDDVEPA